jgi:hypothetical protein
MDHDDHPRSSVTAATSEPHAEWGEHDSLASRLDLRFVVRTWTASLLVSAVFAAVVDAFVILLSDQPVAGASGTDIGLLTIVFSLSTFVGFMVAASTRLGRIAANHMENGLAIGVLHVLVGAVVLLALIALNGTADGVPDPFTGSVLDHVTRTLAVAAIAAPFALVGCLIAIGIAPNVDGDALD